MKKAFQNAMEEQRVKARTAREVTNYMGADATVYDQIDVRYHHRICMAMIISAYESRDHSSDDRERD